MDDKEEFREVKSALDAIGISMENAGQVALRMLPMLVSAFHSAGVSTRVPGLMKFFLI